MCLFQRNATTSIDIDFSFFFNQTDEDTTCLSERSPVVLMRLSLREDIKPHPNGLINVKTGAEHRYERQRAKCEGRPRRTLNSSCERMDVRTRAYPTHRSTRTFCFDSDVRSTKIQNRLFDPQRENQIASINSSRATVRTFYV